MTTIPYNTNTARWCGDIAVWAHDNSRDSDNHDEIQRLLRNLRRARHQELTPRQQEILLMHYEQNLRPAEIARRLGLNRSSVGRTLHRAQARLYRYLQYSL